METVLRERMITVKHPTKKHLRLAVAYALFAGAIAAPFAASPAYALPVEGANAAANAAEATITTTTLSGGDIMYITGKTQQNVLRWEDFSIDAKDTVRFDGGAKTKDYLNLVTGEAMSRIYGTITGGRNVYLVNPHGILFGDNAEVNTGALYLSTAQPSAVLNNLSTFRGGIVPSQRTHSMAMC